MSQTLFLNVFVCWLAVWDNQNHSEPELNMNIKMFPKVGQYYKKFKSQRNIKKKYKTTQD